MSSRSATSGTHGHTKRLVAGIVIAAAAFMADTVSAAPDTYRVVGTGDSILEMVFEAGVIQSADRLWNVQGGRDAFTGNHDQPSTADVWPELVAHSRRGGWLIVQDNGARVLAADWRILMADIAEATPDDRCILGVLPGYIMPSNPLIEDDVVTKAEMMVTELSVQPCTEFIHWNEAVAAHPEFVYDGTHPTEPGIAWLAAEFDRIVGPRAPS